MDSENLIWKKHCNKYKKLPHILPKTKRIIAIGDLHGDLKTTINIFLAAKLIDKNFNWIAKPKNTIVVQVGDQLDSCRPSSTRQCGLQDTFIENLKGDLSIFQFFNYISKKAEKKGGKVLSLIGNHELMNIDEDFRYVSRNDIEYMRELVHNNDKNLSSEELYEIRKLLFKKGNYLAKYIACTRQTAVVIGSNLFIHAGLLPEIAEKYQIKDINTIIRKWLLDILNLDKENRNIGNIGDLIYHSELSPFWTRILGKIPKDISLDDDNCEKYIKPTLKLLNINSMVVGHTPTFISNNLLNSTCDDSLWRIDVGLSNSFLKNKKFNKKQILEILDDKIFNIYEIDSNLTLNKIN